MVFLPCISVSLEWPKMMKILNQHVMPDRNLKRVLSE